MNSDLYNNDVYAQEPVVNEQHKTTYGSMNDWMGIQDRVESTNVPVTMSDSNWLQKTMLTEQKPTFDDKYSRAYTDLSKQIAYRHPNPGKARERQGRIGGSWRHIKEVLGHGGSRVVFVDGLVGTYDSQKFTDQLYEQQFARPHLNSDGYIPAKIGLTTAGIPEYDPLRTARLPSVPDATPRYYDDDVNRKMALLAEDKYKGFYKYK